MIIMLASPKIQKTFVKIIFLEIAIAITPKNSDIATDKIKEIIGIP